MTHLGWEILCETQGLLDAVRRADPIETHRVKTCVASLQRGGRSALLPTEALASDSRYSGEL